MKVLWYTWRYKLFYKTIISGVEVRFLWRLKEPKVIGTVVLVPMRLMEPSVVRTKINVSPYIRKAIANKVKNDGK